MKIYCNQQLDEQPDAEKLKRARSSSSVSELRQLFKDPDWRIRLAVVKNHNASDTIMRLASKDPCPDVRRYVANKIMERWHPKRRYY